MSLHYHLNGRNRQNAEYLHFVRGFYYSYDTTTIDTGSVASSIKNSLAEVRKLLYTALGSASELSVIIEEV